jgi:hypothetical protein
MFILSQTWSPGQSWRQWTMKDHVAALGDHVFEFHALAGVIASSFLDCRGNTELGASEEHSGPPQKAGPTRQEWPPEGGRYAEMGRNSG